MVDEWNMSMEHWWNYREEPKLKLIVQETENADTRFLEPLFRKPKYSEKTLSRFSFVHHKSHADWPGIQPTRLRLEGSE
jgi:hypothetical protein